MSTSSRDLFMSISHTFLNPIYHYQLNHPSPKEILSSRIIFQCYSLKKEVKESEVCSRFADKKTF